MIIEQIIGSIEKRTINIFVNKGTFASSHASFLKLNLQAILTKLNIAINGVIRGKTKMKSMKSAFAPKNNFNLMGITATVLSIDSIVFDNLVANKIMKNNQDMLKTKGQRILIIQKFSVELSENQSVKSANAKIKKMIIGRIIIEIKMTNLETIIPLISFDIFHFKLNFFISNF